MAAEKVKTADAAVIADTTSKENQRIAEARAKLMTTDRILAGEMITVSQGVTEKLFISLQIYDYGEDNLKGKGLYANSRGQSCRRAHQIRCGNSDN